MENEQLMEKVITLCKNRGFIFQANDLYGGLAGFYDYGPLGALLKKNVKDAWIRKFVSGRGDIFLLDSSIVMSEQALRASGHVDGFCDPLVRDEKTGKEYRADHLLEAAGIQTDSLSFADMNDQIQSQNIVSPEGNPLSEVREFNLMLKTQLGSSSDSSSTAYLRPETAQGIFVNYKNVADSMHPKIPFGIAQIGKAYRNEITPRNFIFRLRELEQMELEYFIHPNDWEAQFEYWKDEIIEWAEMIGLDMNKLHETEIGEDDRAHYSLRTVDFEFEYPFGKKELYGLVYRGDYDLSKHAAASKTKLQYTDPQTNETFVPHVIEPSLGLDRTILAILLSSYTEDVLDGSERSYLALPAHIAPYKIAVSPLVKNQEHIVTKAREVFAELKEAFDHVVWDDNGNVGKRYRRQDEIGTPFCVVIDYDTFDDDMISVRDRNTGKQVRVPLKNMCEYFKEALA